jgi:hypothetical protein
VGKDGIAMACVPVANEEADPQLPGPHPPLPPRSALPDWSTLTWRQRKAMLTDFAELQAFVWGVSPGDDVPMRLVAFRSLDVNGLVRRIVYLHIESGAHAQAAARSKR